MTITYEVKTWIRTATTADSGLPGSSELFKHEFSARSIRELLSEIYAFYEVEDGKAEVILAVDEVGRIDIIRLEDKDWCLSPTAGYLVEYSGYVEKVTREPVKLT